MTFGLSDETVKKLHQVFAQYPQIDSVIIYGSRAKGTHTQGSDIDLTLKGKGIDLHLLAKISNAIDDLLTPYTFDLSIWDDIKNPDLRERIVQEGKEFYRK